jgi:hypothetical protein
LTEYYNPSFETIRETWWKWKLPNGHVIKAKIIPISFRISNVEGKNIIDFKSKTIVGLTNVMQNELIATPIPKTKLFQDLNERSVKLEEIEDIEVLNIKNNYYEIYTKEGESLLYINFPQDVKIQKTNKFTPEGEPVYSVNVQQRINLISFDDALLGKIESETDDSELSFDDTDVKTE